MQSQQRYNHSLDAYFRVLPSSLTSNLPSTDPPKKPRILGYVPGTYLISGQSVSLSCLAQGGNPSASLTWYKGSDEKSSKTKVEDDVARSVLSFAVDFRDNEAVYRCDSSNPVLETPDTVNVTLLVYCELGTGRRGDFMHLKSCVF